VTLRVHDTLTRGLREFAPAAPPKVTVYACGPTVYNHVHIGNWSSFLFYDVVVRWLRASGYAVRFVTNVTDVDDKIIRDSRAAGLDRATFVRRWEDEYFAGRTLLGFVEADAYPRASEHVEGMRAMIQRLLDRGHAYLADDGSVYFRIASFPTYGELANLAARSLRAGASGRVRADEYEKESVADFALWKAWDPAHGDVAWEPTFRVDGVDRRVKGHPGWHIECSVMASALLGPRIDLHLGGEDLVFPHHQNEIAQSEAATGERPFSRYWLHRKHLLVDGVKMSKSKGNFHTLKDVIDRGGPEAAKAFRFLVVRAHYRSEINFTWDVLDGAAATLRNLADARARLAKTAGGAAPSDATFALDARAAFRAAMDDDFETSGALGAVQTMIREANRLADADRLGAADAAAALRVLDEADAALGLSLAPTRRLSAEDQALVDARRDARARRDFAEADRLRQALAKRGVLVKDTKDGQDVSFA
jgi:cysteinyl-tRNA synthetase